MDRDTGEPREAQPAKPGRVLGAVALVLFITGGVTLHTGQNQYDTFSQRPPTEVDPTFVTRAGVNTKTNAEVADVGAKGVMVGKVLLGVGGAAALTGIVVAARRPEDDTPSPPQGLHSVD